MGTLAHHLYEIRKGVRRMALHTTTLARLDAEREKIRSMGYASLPLHATGGKVNLVLGEPPCVATIASFGEQNLSRFSPEQDFMLGVLLGYGHDQQCRRYLERKDRPRMAQEPRELPHRVAA